MGRIFQPARTPPGTVPEVISRQIKASQTFTKGAVLIEEAGSTGKVQEASADPTTVYGVALADAFTNPGNSFANSSQLLQVTGTINEVSVAVANRLTIFSGRMVDGDEAIVTPALTDIGVQYGLVKTSADSEWCVDQSETSTKSVEIVDIDIDNKIVYFKFLEAVLANP